ncbi:MAG: BamA/TamA family outer membrane protein [Vampirovibrionales bacterium]|nr:BamA/TamA family outer membrane protein [Vampirovibrionales bacterium]
MTSRPLVLFAATPSLAVVLALSFGILAITPNAYAQSAVAPSEEEQGPTPLSEFAPDDVQQARGKQYDDGLTISRVSIEGNKLINGDKIKESMTLRPGSLYSKSNLSDDLRRIYDMGYFTEKIKATPISTNDGIHIRIEVQENAPITGVNIDGNTIVDDAELQAIFAEQTGLPQNIGQLNESVEKIEQLYADKGYVLARVTGIQDDPDGTINLKINEGAIDSIHYVGNRKTKDFVIKRAMTVKEGDLYNEKTLSEDLKRIFSTQSFSDVRRVITVSPDDPDKYDLTVEVDEKRTGAISLGGGVDTGTGLFGSVGYTDPNFLGRGQNINAIAAVGSGVINRNSDTQANARNYQFEVGWSEPSLFQSVNSLGTSIYGRDYASFNVPLGVERRIGAEINWARPLLSLKNTSFGLSLKGENVNIRDFANGGDLDEFNISDSDREESLKGGTFLTLSPTLAYDTRDNRLNPENGFLGTVSVGGSMGVGATSYGTANVNLRKYFKIRDGVSLAMNAQGGTSLLGDIPTFNMYRLGGAYSIRGFQEGGLGIGNGFMLGSVELRNRIPMFGKLKQVPVLNSLAMATFLDAGTLVGESNLNQSFNRAGLGASVGMGIRVNMPGLGPIRLDYAVPILGGGDYTNRFNFGVGQKF